MYSNVDRLVCDTIIPLRAFKLSFYNWIRHLQIDIERVCKTLPSVQRDTTITTKLAWKGKSLYFFHWIPFYYKPEVICENIKAIEILVISRNMKRLTCLISNPSTTSERISIVYRQFRREIEAEKRDTIRYRNESGGKYEAVRMAMEIAAPGYVG
jgi:hypothetical protein